MNSKSPLFNRTRKLKYYSIPDGDEDKENDCVYVPSSLPKIIEEEVDVDLSNAESEITNGSQPNSKAISFNVLNEIVPTEKSISDLFDETDTIICDEDEVKSDDDALSLEKKRKMLKERIESSKKFYRENFGYQILLNHESYVRFSKIENFKYGYKYKNKVDNMSKIELLCQLVNERIQVKYVCRRLYFRESAVRLEEGQKNLLLRKYIGKSTSVITGFKSQLEQEIKELVWCLGVYRERFLYIKSLLCLKLGLEEEAIKSIKDYDDVYEYFIIHLDFIEDFLN